jgi:hypothetical protein
MQGNPMDMFDEVDGMFARLFSRMNGEFLDGAPQGHGYRFMVRHTGEGPKIGEKADDAAPCPV